MLALQTTALLCIGFRVQGFVGTFRRAWNPNYLQFYGLYLLIRGELLVNCRLSESAEGLRGNQPVLPQNKGAYRA